MEEDQNSVEEEFTPQDLESTIVEEAIEEEFQDDSQAQEENPQERNFKNLRKKEQDAVRRAEEAERKSQMHEDMIKQLLQAQQNNQAPVQAPVEVDEFDSIPDDEYLSKGQARKLNQKDARTIAREEMLRFEKEREQSRFIDRLKSKYSDFSDVVTTATIAIFEKQEPELAATIADLKDPYKMGLQTYNFIKRNVGASNADDERHAKEVRTKVEKNEKTVQSPQAFNKRPMAKAFDISGMSKGEQTKLYEEMMGHAGRVGGGY